MRLPLLCPVGLTDNDSPKPCPVTDSWRSCRPTFARRTGRTRTGRSRSNPSRSRWCRRTHTDSWNITWHSATAYPVFDAGAVMMDDLVCSPVLAFPLVLWTVLDLELLVIRQLDFKTDWLGGVLDIELRSDGGHVAGLNLAVSDDGTNTRLLTVLEGPCKE